MEKLLFKFGVATLFAASLAFGGCGDSNSTQNTASTQKQEQKVQTEKKHEVQWNKSEPDAMKNGNFALAVKELKKNNNALSDSAVNQDAASVIKAPWNYYGQIISFTGIVASVQAEPPESKMGKVMGGQCGEIVMQSDQETIVDAMVSGDVTGIENGQQVTIYAYPVGRTEVPNRIGGSFTHLVVVGRLN